MFARSAIRTAVVAVGLSLSLASVVTAQGRGHGGPPHVPPGQAKKVVTVDRATVVTREVLVKHGYEIVRVERVRGTQVVYYRRRHHGKGKGRVEKLIVRPARERVVFESAPDRVLVDINVRLGF
jgi:hypothetical protein